VEPFWAPKPPISVLPPLSWTDSCEQANVGSVSAATTAAVRHGIMT
jgi:hypothetical protein